MKKDSTAVKHKAFDYRRSA